MPLKLSHVKEITKYKPTLLLHTYFPRSVLFLYYVLPSPIRPTGSMRCAAVHTIITHPRTGLFIPNCTKSDRLPDPLFLLGQHLTLSSG